MKAVGTGGNKKEFELCPKGTRPGRIFYIVDLGTQQDKGFDGEPKIQHKARIAVEFAGTAMTDGRPFAIGKDYNLNLGRAPRPGKPAPNFTNPLKDLIEACTGKDCPVNKDGYFEFELDQLMGQTAMFNVIHYEKANGETGAKIKGVFPIPEGVTVPPMVNKPTLLSLDPKEFDLVVYEGLSDWWKSLIQKSPEGKLALSPRGGQPKPVMDDGISDEAPQGAPGPDDDSDIPF